jgi:hypothetical protein
MQSAQGSRRYLCHQPNQEIEFIVMPSKNPARGSGRAQFLSFNLTNALICALASSSTCRAQSLYCASLYARRASRAFGFTERRNKAIAPTIMISRRGGHCLTPPGTGMFRLAQQRPGC